MRSLASMRSLARKCAGFALAGLLSVLAGALPALAQEPSETQGPDAQRVERDVLFIRRSGPAGAAEGQSDVFWYGAGEPGLPLMPPGAPHAGPQMAPMISFVSAVGEFGGRTVTGAPYSAEAVTEIEQRLADGNRIARRTTATVYRDSEGRTRRDQTLSAVGPWVVGEGMPLISSIFDAVAGSSYMLNHADKTAHKLPSFAMSPIASGLGREIRRQVHAEVHAGLARAGVAAIAGGGEPSEAGGDVQTFEMAVPPPPPSIGFRARVPGLAPASDQRTESLGKQLIEGIEAEGTRSISTIPAGAIGNDFAIEIVSERWYSPELQVIVLSLHKDPRFGETTYRLTNIQRSEPPRSLFEVPAGYTLIEPGVPVPPPTPAP